MVQPTFATNAILLSISSGCVFVLVSFDWYKVTKVIIRIWIARSFFDTPLVVRYRGLSVISLSLVFFCRIVRAPLTQYYLHCVLTNVLHCAQKHVQTVLMCGVSLEKSWRIFSENKRCRALPILKAFEKIYRTFPSMYFDWAWSFAARIENDFPA